MIVNWGFHYNTFHAIPRRSNLSFSLCSSYSSSSSSHFIILIQLFTKNIDSKLIGTNNMVLEPN